MLLGKPVVATGFSGNVDFMNKENSLLVDYSVVPIGKTILPYDADMRWAVPSEEHAAVLMRRLYDDRAFGSALGARAQEELQLTLGVAAAGRRMAERLASLREARLARPGQASPPAVPGRDILCGQERSGRQAAKPQRLRRKAGPYRSPAREREEGGCAG
ncbi:MAG: hypothetical protein U1E33_08450 [Rhodospirillales bacterium]